MLDISMGKKLVVLVPQISIKPEMKVNCFRQLAAPMLLFKLHKGEIKINQSSNCVVQSIQCISIYYHACAFVPMHALHFLLYKNMRLLEKKNQFHYHLRSRVAFSYSAAFFVSEQHSAGRRARLQLASYGHEKFMSIKRSLVGPTKGQ